MEKHIYIKEIDSSAKSYAQNYNRIKVGYLRPAIELLVSYAVQKILESELNIDCKKII